MGCSQQLSALLSGAAAGWAENIEPRSRNVAVQCSNVTGREERGGEERHCAGTGAGTAQVSLSNVPQQLVQEGSSRASSMAVSRQVARMGSHKQAGHQSCLHCCGQFPVLSPFFPTELAESPGCRKGSLSLHLCHCNLPCAAGCSWGW